MSIFRYLDTSAVVTNLQLDHIIFLKYFNYQMKNTKIKQLIHNKDY